MNVDITKKDNRETNTERVILVTCPFEIITKAIHDFQPRWRHR